MGRTIKTSAGGVAITALSSMLTIGGVGYLSIYHAYPKMKEMVNRMARENLEPWQVHPLPFNPDNREQLLVPIQVKKNDKGEVTEVVGPVMDPLAAIEEAKTKGEKIEFLSEQNPETGKHEIVFHTMHARDKSLALGVDPETKRLATVRVPGWDMEAFIQETKARKIQVDKIKSDIDNGTFFGNVGRARADNRPPSTNSIGGITEYLPYIGPVAGLLMAAVTNFSLGGMLGGAALALGGIFSKDILASLNIGNTKKVNVDATPGVKKPGEGAAAGTKLTPEVEVDRDRAFAAASGVSLGAMQVADVETPQAQPLSPPVQRGGDAVTRAT